MCCSAHTTTPSDFSPPFVLALRLSPLPTGLLRCRAANDEISRFSCMQFLDVLSSPTTWDQQRTRVCARYGLAFPLCPQGRHPNLPFSKLNHPAHRCLCLRFDCGLTTTPARLEVRMVRYSFPVRLLHSRLHAGLSRRTDIAGFCTKSPKQRITCSSGVPSCVPRRRR
jgi:hypothetical protein